jgi:hypothetical protein
MFLKDQAEFLILGQAADFRFKTFPQFEVCYLL